MIVRIQRVSRRTMIASAGIALVAFVVTWGLLVAIPNRYRDDAAAEPGATTEATAGADRKIKATVFYGSEDGMRLIGVERDVQFQSATADQARRIIEAQLEPAPAPYISVIPEGTKLRALYVTNRGEAFVDLSLEVTTGHPGGSLGELYTVYGIVNALTVSLPAISAVQILVEGKEVDTLAGHVDLRHPLQKNSSLVTAPMEAQASAGEATGEAR